MPTKSRRTGIEVLGQIPWEAHVCLLYETKQDLIETAAAYFEAGLRDREFCLWAVSEPLTVDEARSALAQRIENFDAHWADGAIEIVCGQDWYLSDGKFDLSRLAARWEQKYRYVEDRGFVGMRASGNAFWLATPQSPQFLEYERALEASFAGKRIIALCTYQIDGNMAGDLMDVAHTHQRAIARRNNKWHALESTELQDPSELLTEREVEVIAWVARGKSAWEISHILEITTRTVESHVQTSMRKLGAANRAEVVAIAIRRRIIVP